MVFGIETPSAQEEARQRRLDDANFYKKFVYAFEIRCEDSSIFDGVVGTGAIYPLILNPTGMTMSSPYTVATVPGLDGSLYVEENGIIMRELRIQGTTGFFPKASGVKSAVPALNFDRQKSYHDRLKTDKVFDKLSGQKHFQFMQDRVFNAYGELKRDPILGPKTQMRFHNFKDNESWIVVPQNFTMTRRRTVYDYDIQLLIIGSALTPELQFVKDEGRKGFLGAIDSINSDIKSARAFVKQIRDEAQVAYAEVNKYTSAVSSVIDNVAGVMTDVNLVIGDMNNFVTGTTDQLLGSFRRVLDATDGLKDVLEQTVNLPSRIRDKFAASARRLQDTLYRLGLVKSRFAPEVPKVTIQVGQTAQAVVNRSDSSTDPQTLQQLSAAEGTNPLAYQVELAKLQNRFPDKQYKSAKLYSVKAGDTLDSISIRFFGVNTETRNIATLNNLQYPFISDQRIPGTVTAGDRILVPSNEEPVTSSITAGIVGVSPTSSATDRIYGTDLMVNDADELEIDVAGGSVDVKSISGIPNVEQAIKTIVRTTKGQDSLAPQIGIAQIVGTRVREIDEILSKFRIAEAISLDPRIASVDNIELNEAQNPDTIEPEIVVRIRGTDNPVTVTGELRSA